MIIEEAIERGWKVYAEYRPYTIDPSGVRYELVADWEVVCLLDYIAAADAKIKNLEGLLAEREASE